MRKASAVNVPGSKSKEFWVKSGIRGDQINILHSTVDTENDFYPAPEPREYDFIFIGELSPRKLVHLIIGAVGELIREGRDVKLVIIGEGPSKEELQRQVRLLRISEHVAFLGHQSQIRDLLNKSRIFVLLSQNEGLPCALMEAMACGLTVVASNVADITDVLIDGDTGYLVNDHRPEAVLKILKRAYRDYDRTEVMRKKARQKIVAEHSYQAAAGKWDQLLEQMASRFGV